MLINTLLWNTIFNPLKYTKPKVDVNNQVLLGLLSFNVTKSNFTQILANLMTSEQGLKVNIVRRDDR